MVDRDAALCDRAGALGALHGRAALRERDEAGAPCERAGALRDNADERAAALHGRASGLGALHGRAALHMRAEVGALCKRAWVAECPYQRRLRWV